MSRALGPVEEAGPDLNELKASLKGQAIGPGDDGYDDARVVYNAAYDLRPAAIARVADAGDVATAVSFARERGLELAIRGGGHGLAGHGVVDGGLVVDTSSLRGLEIDPVARTATAGAGLTAGEYTDAAGAHGLATGFGDSGEVGIAGLTLGGGMGFLSRRHGLTVDSLLGAELVTADGQVLAVDADRHPDLFWAIRGGGGNFGVLTSLRFRLGEVGTVLGGALVLPSSAETLRAFVDVATEAPEALSTIALLAPAPPMPFVPADHHGRLALIVLLVWSGDVEEGRHAIDELRAVATPIADAVEPMPYPAMFQEEPQERYAIGVRSAYVDGIDGSMADAIVERMRSVEGTGDQRATQIRVLGGAISRVPDDATAYPHRRRRAMLTLAAMGPSPSEGGGLSRWVDEYARFLGIEDAPGYVNFMGAGAPIAASYPAATYERLVEVKRRYDPENVFRSNHNIAP